MHRLRNKDFNISVMTVAISVLLQFFFIRYASYDISKIDYGNYVLLQTLIVGLSSILMQIPGQAFDRFYNTSSHKNTFINEFRTLLIGINLISIIFILLYGLIIQRFSTEILIMIFISFLLINNYALNQRIFLLDLERTKYFYLKVMEASSKFLFPIIFYTIWRSLESLLLGVIIGYTFSYTLLLFFLKGHKFFFTINADNLRKYFLFAYPFVFVSVMNWGLSFSDRYFIDYFMTTEDVAIYSLLAMVAGVGQIIGQIYITYAEPKILQRYETNKTETLTLITGYLKKLTLLFFILTIIAFFLPKEIYTILLTKEIVYNSYYFMTMIILLIAIFISVLHTVHHMHFKLSKRLDLLAYIYLIALVVNITGNLFIATYGIMAAALATVAAYLTILLLQMLFVKKYLQSAVLHEGN